MRWFDIPKPCIAPRGQLALCAVALAVWMGCGVSRAPEQELPTAEVAAPDFALPSVAHGEVRLGEVLERGPAVVVFYRGQW